MLGLALLTAVAVAAVFTLRQKEAPALRLGYCPTMDPAAFKIAGNGRLNIQSRRYASTADALRALFVGEIDAAVVGRKARPYEVSSQTRQVSLREGATLVTAKTRAIDASDLGSVRIHTALPKEEVDRMLPGHMNIVSYSTTAEARSAGMDEAVLLDWEDVGDSDGFLLPMEGGARVERFRRPTLVFNAMPEGALEDIEEAFRGEKSGGER